MGKAINMAGKTYGRLAVIRLARSTPSGLLKWLCRCSCGIEVEVIGSNLRNGHTSSCGCYRKEEVSRRRTTHGASTGSRLWRIWKAMRQRCSLKSRSNYKWYGGLGVTVCPEWETGFEAFQRWATANGYSDFLSIDRIDVNGNYEPSNCRWATATEQARNKRKSTKPANTEMALSA